MSKDYMCAGCGYKIEEAEFLRARTKEGPIYFHSKSATEDTPGTDIYPCVGEYTRKERSIVMTNLVDRSELEIKANEPIIA